MASDQPPPPDYNADEDESMFASTISTGGANIPLDDDDDDDNEESPFGAPSNPSLTPSSPKPAFDLSRNNENLEQVKDDSDDDEDPFGVKKPSSPSSPPPPSTTFAQVPSSSPQPSPSAPPPPSNDLYANVPSSPSSSAATYEKQVSSSTPDYKADYSESTPASKAPRQRINEGEVEITVSDPTKVGDGMSSYMVYRITTKTTLSTFKKPEFSVSRRFSDFLGLHAKLINKHLHAGLIIPSPPEKDAVGMAKVKISKEDNIPSDFIDRRRALLERYLNRLAQHDKLIIDPDVQEFLELDRDLPKSKETAALSGAGVMRAFSGISSSVSKLTTKTGEQDQWFEERHVTLLELYTQLKHVYNQLNNLFGQRREAGLALRQFSTSVNHLATIEEHPSLSHALAELANVEEKLDQINNEHAYKEYSIVTELVKEYMSLLEMVQAAFTERIKMHQQWLNAEETLRKRRDEKVKLEQSPKGADKLPQKEVEIREWEGRVETTKRDFEHVSISIKEEMEIFEQTRIDDFKKAVNQYWKNLIEQQEKILQLWEGYLPEANQITV